MLFINPVDFTVAVIGAAALFFSLRCYGTFRGGVFDSPWAGIIVACTFLLAHSLTKIFISVEQLLMFEELFLALVLFFIVVRFKDGWEKLGGYIADVCEDVEKGDYVGERILFRKKP